MDIELQNKALAAGLEAMMQTLHAAASEAAMAAVLKTLPDNDWQCVCQCMQDPFQGNKVAVRYRIRGMERVVHHTLPDDADITEEAVRAVAQDIAAVLVEPTLRMMFSRRPRY
jgi:hypothetical protein